MSTPKNLVTPDYKYTYPSERAYADESKSALGAETIYDETKSGADYGITDPQVTVKVTAGGADNGSSEGGATGG
ncbi:hypothetical protein [Rosenbergiella metrosideri]|uniref:hypothetical protein n=1 Tax=Rosenbergiella metrosideri TaxID=2921185 RepID=UPI001F4F3C0C|nr:hypothetical protein [Rosenbergiella metrosideri]